MVPPWVITAARVPWLVNSRASSLMSATGTAHSALYCSRECSRLASASSWKLLLTANAPPGVEMLRATQSRACSQRPAGVGSSLPSSTTSTASPSP
ncbi:hypothetical protein D3C80_1240240 [compost metagenome]